MHQRLIRIVSTCFLCAILLSNAFAQEKSPAFVWIEGENTSAINVKPTIAGWGHKEFLSDEKWLQISIDADKIEKELPSDGAVLRYDVAVASSGEYTVWNRIGYEFVRSSFDWRIDDGAWQTISPEMLTTDLMALATWNEVAWLKMGGANLIPGKHTLTIRLPKTTAKDGKAARVLYASDALCLINGDWRPDGRRKPDQPIIGEATLAKFALPAADGNSMRRSIGLNGVWQIARDDEQLPGETATPLSAPSENLNWKTIAVPGDKNIQRPDLLMAHRLWYRTTVNVGATTGHSYFLKFPQNSLNTTVYVNGVYCGFDKNPFANVQIDIGKAIKPGDNVIWVGIRDAWYGYSTNPKNPRKLRKVFNLPYDNLRSGFQDLAYPIWGHPESGILATPILTETGNVYVRDLFCKPSVAKKRLDVDITLKNPTDKAINGEYRMVAVNSKTGKVEKEFGSQPFSLPANGEATIAAGGDWQNPELWWPDKPTLYNLRTTVLIDGKVSDLHDQPFGFREWGKRGKDFTLNGIVWHVWAELAEENTPNAWLDWYRKTNQRTMRFWGTEWYGLRPDETLDFFDKNGVVVRRSGILDGQAIGNNAIENDPDLKALYKSDIKMDLMQNWRDQMVAQVHGERNHPSVMLWSIENEWLYINCINLYGNLMDAFEAEVTKTSEAVHTVDPTRLNMTDGGGANKDQSMPVHGNHYVFSGTGEPGRYPDLAYSDNVDGGGRGRWVWDKQRPRFIGEDYFATGINPFDYAAFGGEKTFQGKAQSRDAASLILRMLTEGYRWAEYGGFHFWLGDSAVNPQTAYKSNPETAVFCREWDSTFGSGQSVKRQSAIFNDSRLDDPVAFTATLSDGKQVVSTVQSVHNVPAGQNEKFIVNLPMPSVVKRTEMLWTFTLTRNGNTIFHDTKSYSVLPAIGTSAFPVFNSNGQTAGNPYLYDPHGEIAAFLTRRGVRFSSVKSLDNLPLSGKLLIVGRDALSESESGSSRLAAYASGGRSVIVLEQSHPLHYQGLPFEMETTETSGTVAFAEDVNHPIFRGLMQKDLFVWGGDGTVYRHAYRKPTRGARSLVQCDVRLQDSALVEAPVGSGVMIVCQMPVGEKLVGNIAAQRLFANMVNYAAVYKPIVRSVVVVPGNGKDSDLLTGALDKSGLQYTKATDVAAALQTKAKIAVVEADADHLKSLVGNLSIVRQFTKTGGWLVLHGLTPAGLADYNKIVGVEHMIRPFRRERVGFPPARSPLVSGLTLGDVVMLSGEAIFNYTDDKYVASDIYSYLVDFDDVAPFAQLPDDYSYNTVNGFVTADAWKYIYSFDLGRTPNPTMPYKLPKAEEITEIEWIGNTIYNPTTKIELIFDGAKKIAFDTKPNNEPQIFALPAGYIGKEIDLRIADWNKIGQGANVVGIDNIRLKAKRSPAFYKRVHPLVNVGGLMAYDDPNGGTGGMILANLLFKEREEVPENADKKRRILSTILANLKAPFAGGKSVIAGARLKYAPIEIAKSANQYRDARGWFGDKAFTFADLPTGRQVFAGVPFQIYDFATSPVPTVIMLKGDGIPNNLADTVRGIPVNTKADALFFLQTARIDAHRNNDERRDKKRYEMAKYVVTYADGQTADVPIYAEIDVDDYRQPANDVKALPGAQVAWTKNYTGTSQAAVAYLMSWNNPRPNIPIKSVDLVYGKDRRGVPALIAITAARAE